MVFNGNKTLVGWNLDLLDMEYRVREADAGVYIEINDATEGWMPLFGASSVGDFVGMPTCWPYDDRSDPVEGSVNIIMLDIDLLLQRKTFAQVRDIVAHTPVCSVPGLTFMGALSDASGNVLHIVPGQGVRYYERPRYVVLTNFSPFKQDAERHPWMGWDRYWRADEMLRAATDDFDVENMFGVLRDVAQQVCPTVVSMVYDVSARQAYWCEKQAWQNVQRHDFVRHV